MKCQRKKIDNKECVSKLFRLDENAVAYYHGLRVCQRCYKKLTFDNKEKNQYKNKLSNGNIKCTKCGKQIPNSYYHFCIDCFREMVSSGKLKMKRYAN